MRDQRKAKDIAITNLEKRIEEFEGSVLQARETIRNLCETASVTDIDQLRIAIRNSDHLRELNQSLSTVAAALTQEGDGLTINELIEECAIADIDQIVAREETLQEDLKNLRAQFIEAAECRTRTRNALNAFGGEARAAEAAAVRQTALAEMREAVEEYIRVRTSATLLQWAIERYRREKQAPLLKRAGEIFAVLTGGSFIDLRLEFDEQDNPHLAGLRADGQFVRVTGMSTGTADQLYLALRVSSIEDYLGRASAVPFVVDDLFINFDNERAAAGFQGARRPGQENPNPLLYPSQPPRRNRSFDPRKFSQHRAPPGSRPRFGGLIFSTSLAKSECLCAYNYGVFSYQEAGAGGYRSTSNCSSDHSRLLTKPF